MKTKSVILAGLVAVALLLAGSAEAAKKGSLLNPAGLTEEAPSKYRVKFETSKGEFEVFVKRKWAPLGADRFYNLVRVGYYDGVRFFRVVEGFVVQFGISGEPQVNRAWKDTAIEDDPVTQKNVKGTVSFASAGKNSRTTQIFINLVDNTRLDAMGFAPIGRVTKGMATVVNELYSGYGEKLLQQQHKIVSGGNAYLDRSFPNLDFIEKATIVEE